MKTILLALGMLCAVHSNGGKLPAHQIHMIDKKTNAVTCTPQTLWLALKQYDIKNPEIVFAQAMLESGELTSKLFKVNHNLFGMKLPEIRKTTAIGEHWRHAKYRNWIDCIRDYKLWQESRHITNTLSSTVYLAKLVKYAEDPRYLYKIKNKLNEEKETENNRRELSYLL